MLWVTLHFIIMLSPSLNQIASMAVHLVWLTESVWVGAHLAVVGHLMSSQLTTMTWLPHLSISVTHLTLVASNSVHSAQSLLVSCVGCGGECSALRLSPLLGFHGLLLGLDVLLSLLLVLVEHVADLAKVVDLRVARVELVVLVGALDRLVPSLLLSLSLILNLLGLFSLFLARLGGGLCSLLGGILLVACLLDDGLLLLSLLWLCWLLLRFVTIHLFENIDNDIGLRSIWLRVRAQLCQRVIFLHFALISILLNLSA